MPSTDTEDVNAAMSRHARAAAEMVRAEYGHDLDFSESTVGAVEAILNGLWKERDDNSNDMFANAALLFGSYIGEMIRTCFPQASWLPGSLTPDAPSPVLRVGDIDLSPVAWCFKRLYNGPKDSVVEKYLAFREAIDARNTPE
jgi:hypothetical protein